MLRLYSKGCEYALRGLMHCAENRRVHDFRDICRKARIPEHFTRKMFQKLAQKGMLRSIPGPGGGFLLARPPERVNLRQVIEAIDGKGAFRACVMGMASCRPDHPCALHHTWVAAKARLLPDLEATTLGALMKKGRRASMRRRRREPGTGKGSA